jgi:DNA-binding MarR family transcriptional regulator
MAAATRTALGWTGIARGGRPVCLLLPRGLVPMQTAPLLHDPNLQDLLRLSAAAVAVSRVLERALNTTGISLSQALALAAIEAAPQPLLLNGLAARLVQEAQSVTSLMDRLESAGMARRAHDLSDRRAIRVELTDTGRQKLIEIGPLLTAAAEQVCGKLTSQQAEASRSGFLALYEACRAYPGVRLPPLVPSE